MAAANKAAIVDHRVERSAADTNHFGAEDVGQSPQTTVDVNGELATTFSELSASPKPVEVPATTAAACDGKTKCPPPPLRHFVVVAIDFGTALSGYAFAFVRDPCRAIHMMRRWDGGDPGVVNQKTPTTLLLDPLGRFHSFGYTARDFYHDLDEDEARQWLYFDKFKMTLHHADVMIVIQILHV